VGPSNHVSELRVEHEQARHLKTAIWLGENSPLLDAAWSVMTIYHVRDTNALFQALSRQVARVLVLDLVSFVSDPTPLLQQLRHQWPAVGILALVEVPADTALADVQLYEGIDRYLSRNATPPQLDTLMDELLQQVTQRLAEKEPQSTSGDGFEASRMRQLEGLVQASLTVARVADEGDILGDLREVARVTVDADDVAVLITDDQQQDLYDVLRLDVSEDYLAACRVHLQSLPLLERLQYLGDEVLLRERRPDMAESVRVREAAAAGAWSYMRLPLTLEQHLVGFVALFSNTPGQFDGAHLQLGRLFAAQVAIAVRNMRFYYRLHRAEERQRAVSEVARLIAEDLALDTVLGRIAEEAVRLVAGDTGLVLLVQPDGRLEVRAASNFARDVVGSQVQPGTGQAGRIAQTGEPSVITNYRDWPDAIPARREDFPANGILFGVPLTYRGSVLGVLQVVVSGPLPTYEIQDLQEALITLAPQAATAIAKAQLHEMVRQDRQQLRAILDHTAAAVVVCDAVGRVLMLNPVAELLIERLGFAVKAVKDELVPQLLHDWLPTAPWQALEELGNIIEVNLGEVGEYLVHIAPITKSDGTVDRYVAVGQEVSALRRAERMKSDLIHILSHDLRNPLGLARGSIELLDEPDLPQEQRAQLKDMIVHSLDRMDQLIQDVMDLEQVESAGGQTAVPFRLPVVVRKVVEQNRTKAARQGITLNYTETQAPPHQLHGHAVLVGQAVENLIGNAIKYTPAGGTVDVSLNVEGRYAVIRVKDTGYGIPADSLPHLFQKFYRVPDTRIRHIHGTGLGLSVVKASADVHGGYVTVNSELDKGSEFALYLPLVSDLAGQGPAGTIARLDLSPFV
jgi:signal transduction histidine kinase